MYCLDRTDSDVSWNIYGSSEMEKHRRLDLLFLPCTPKLKTEENKDDPCTLEKLDTVSY
jgi:hypothetical protein